MSATSRFWSAVSNLSSLFTPPSTPVGLPIDEAGHPLINHPITAALNEDTVGLGIATAGYGADADDHLYRRLSQAQRELPPVIQDRAIRLAWSLYETNPLAHGIIETIRDHVVAKGFTWRASDKAAQAILNRNWRDPINRWGVKQFDRVRDLSLFGELILAVFVNKADGFVRFASIDPGHVRAVYTNPDNPEDVWTIVVNPRRLGNELTAGDKFYRVIHMDEDINSTTFGRLIGASEGEQFTVPGGRRARTYDGSVFFFTINRVVSALRGRSDLMSTIDWLDAYDQMLFNFIDRTILTNAFVWDVKLQGATESQITSWKTKHAAIPRPGTVNVHNETEEWKEVSPTLGRSTYEIEQKTIKGQTLAASGLPPHWFGETETTRASANEMALPTMRRLEARQLLVQDMFKQIAEFIIDQAIIAGKLPKPDVDAATQLEIPYEVEVIAPKISGKDLSSASTSMVNVVQAIVLALKSMLIDKEEAQKMLAVLAAELGADIDLKTLRERMLAAGIEDTDIGMAGGTGTNLNPEPGRIVPASPEGAERDRGRGLAESLIEEVEADFKRRLRELRETYEGGG